MWQTTVGICMLFNLYWQAFKMACIFMPCGGNVSRNYTDYTY